jgi:hypothetical protein
VTQHTSIREIGNASSYMPGNSTRLRAVDDELYRHVLRVVTRLLRGKNVLPDHAIPAEIACLPLVQNAIPLRELAQCLAAAISKRGTDLSLADLYHSDPETQMVWSNVTHIG